MKKFLTSLALLLLLFTVSAKQTVKTDTISIQTNNIVSPAKVCVILPQKALCDTCTEKFPTVYLLNGYGGDYASWVKSQPELSRLADLYGMIIVTPDGRDSWYWDSPIDPKMQMESYIIDDLVPYIDANYPTIQSPAKRAITGLSMGGHGALWLAFRHSDIFGNAGSMSGGVDIRPFDQKWKIKLRIGEYKANPEVWNRHTVINLVPSLKNGQVNITFDCGVDDFFSKVNYNLHKALLSQGIDHDYAERPGVHNWKYWNNSILYHLLFFNQKFNGK